MTLLSNPTAIFILGILIGWAVNVNFIGAQADLVSRLPPVDAIYIGVGYSLFFTFFLKKFRLKRLKFADFSALSLAVFAGLHVLLVSIGDLSPGWKAAIWFALALFGLSFMRWMIVELAIKYLDPPRAQAYFSYLTTADEIGSLAAAGSIWMLGTGTSANQIVWMVIALSGLAGMFIVYQFLNEKNFEIRFSKRELAAPIVDPKLVKGFILALAILTLLFGFAKTGEEYLVRIVMKNQVGGFEGIKLLISRYTFVASALTILGSILVGRLSQAKRISPVILLQFHAAALFVMAVLCWFFPTMILFVSFEITRLVTGNCLYRGGHQSIVGSFIADYRKRLNATYNFYFFIAASLPLGFLFSFTHRLPFLTERSIVLVVLLVSLAAAFPVILWLKKSLIQLHYQFIDSGHKIAAIHSVQAQSYLRPPDFGPRMRELLTTDPKKMLRRTIILGLGYLHDRDSTETIIREFRSDKEVIQFAVLNALRVSGDYEATQFMFKVLSGEEKPKSLNVRMHATFIVAHMYGKKSIPILLGEIDSPEPRIVANTLETLAFFRDEALIPYFRKMLNAENNRIRANALMGLGLIRSTRGVYRELVEIIFRKDEPNMVASALYVVGRIADFKSAKYVEQVAGSPLRENLAVKPLLAYAFVKLKDRRGFELFGELFSLPYQADTMQRVLNLFSQLSRETRFEMIRHLVIRRRDQPGFDFNLANNLRHSPFNYYEEIDYIHFLAQQVVPNAGARGETGPATV